jgi:hypothetical protein
VFNRVQRSFDNASVLAADWQSRKNWCAAWVQWRMLHKSTARRAFARWRRKTVQVW